MGRTNPASLEKTPRRTTVGRTVQSTGSDKETERILTRCYSEGTGRTVRLVLQQRVGQTEQQTLGHAAARHAVGLSAR